MTLSKYPSSSALIFTFLENVRRSKINSISGLNPTLINVNGEQMYVYIKNLSPAQMSNDNPDVWRIQLPKRDDFEFIRKSNRMFILLGYDHIRRVYTTWNPYWCKQRLNIAESCSMYSRLSLQVRVARNQKIERYQLQNDSDVICIPSSLIANYLLNIRSYYPEESVYTAVGSSIQKRTNEEKQVSQNSLSFNEDLEIIEPEGGSISNNPPSFELDEFGKLESLDSIIIEQLLPKVREVDYPDWEEIIKEVKRYYPEGATEKMNPVDWMNLFDRTKWKASKTGTFGQSQETNGRKPKQILRVDFPDGRVVEEMNVSNTYCEFIKEVGAEAVNILEIYHAGVNIVSRELDQKYSDYQRDIGDGWYVLTNSPTATKYQHIQTIIKEYGLNIKASLISIGKSEQIASTIAVEQKNQREKIRVTFPGGRAIQPSRVLDALIEVVKYAGAEKVRLLNIICCGNNLILKNPTPRYVNPSKPVGGGWLCNTCSDTRTKYEQIKYISEKLGLGLKVELM